MTSVLLFILTYSIATSCNTAPKLQAKKIKYDGSATPTLYVCMYKGWAFTALAPRPIVV
jgi:hypothetical protein